MAAHSLEILKVIDETPDSISIVFDIPRGSESAFHYRPGQFLTLRIPGSPAASRCYSLSSAPGSDSHLQVTVKRTPAGYASNWLCDNVVAGMNLDVLPPSGTFVPRRWDVDFVLMAAGSGITPVMSILREALDSHTNRITLIYANRDPKSTIFADQLRALQARHPNRLNVVHWLESESGLPTAAGLRPHLAIAGHEAFLCGPAAFMDVAATALADSGLHRDRIHREKFASLTTDAFQTTTSIAVATADCATATVNLDGDQHVVSWPRDSVLLDVLLANGIDAPYVCREGNCGGCAYTLRNGEVTMRVNDTLDQYDLDHGVRLACQSIPKTDHVVVHFDR